MNTTATIPSTLEWYRLGNHRRRKLAYIQRLCEQIAADFHPERIILFGSYAYGKPTADSDVDLLVVMPYKGRHTTQAIRILQHLNMLAPVDLLVRSPEEIRERLTIGDRFMQEIIDCGKVMYEADHTRMDHQG